MLCRLATLVEELNALKKQGNEAFKAGKADLAYVHYNQAQVPSARFLSVTPIFVLYYIVDRCLFFFALRVESTLASIVPASVLPSAGDLKWVLV